MKKYIFSSLLCLVCLSSCLSDWEVDNDDPQLVVEAWIANGQAPVVQLTSSLEVTTHRNEFTAADVEVHWGLVTMSDGERTVVLHGRADKNYMTGYIFTTGEMFGEEGKTYTLHIEAKGHVADATTTIPPTTPIDSLRFIETSRSDTAINYHLHAYFTDNPAQHNYYKLFTRDDDKRQGTFLSNHLQVFDDVTLGEHVDVLLLRGRSILTNSLTAKTDYQSGDVVTVMLAQIDSTSYNIWSDIEHQSSLANFPIFTPQQTPRYNVKGAIGYFCGYGASYATIKAK